MRVYERIWAVRPYAMVLTHSWNLKAFVLPHHPVIRENNTTTKLRVVIDCFLKTSTKCSLNNLQFIGSSIQADLFFLLIKFRKQRYVVTVDIEKIYRQHLQQILWRKNLLEQLQTYQLTTVTYGCRAMPAPYLAIRCIHELAEQHEVLHCRVSQIMKNEIYIDESVQIVLKKSICLYISSILNSADLNLKKLIKSNNIKLDDNHIETNKDEIKTRGIGYRSTTDSLFYSFRIYSKITLAWIKENAEW